MTTAGTALSPTSALPERGTRPGRRPWSRLRVVGLRLRDAFIVLFIVMMTIFFLGSVVGSPEEQLVSQDATPEELFQAREILGLNRPLINQVGSYLSGIVRGDLGDSVVIARGVPALSLVTDRLSATLKLTIAGIIVSAVLGVGFGVASGVRPGSLFDRASTSVALACVSFPYFWFGMLMIIFFAVNLRWVPVLADDRQLASYFLPAFTLAINHGGRLFQLSRSATFDELSKSYITVATAKGLTHRAVVTKHVLRNIGILIATMVGWEYARMWGGTVFLTEFVFAWPGMGKLVTDAASRHDFHVIEAGVVVAGLFVVGANLVVDIVYSLIDRRVEVD